MLRYSLAKIAKRPKGTVVELPPIEERLSTVKQYHAALRVMLAGIAAETRETIIPLYRAELEHKRAVSGLMADADRSWFQRVAALATSLQRSASETVNRILGLEAQRHTAGFMAAAKKALGIDLRAVVRDEDLEEYLRDVAGRNASLIQGLADDVIKRIEQTVYENSIAGNSVTTLRKALTEQFGIADRRAGLIARDQSAKLNSDLNRIRQQQAGITTYKWLTSRDERVRARHKKLEGKEYKWGEPTGAENGLPPGQPIQCRCLARAIVEF
ncbi:minor capsid protein [Rhizobium sp. CFBP 8762]|uniref:phage head morphogenesis protein n=1 Tax=Rhizobium sp. CFBP 8762 TaxID=2775279 RepID=UPI0017808A8E|nr:phage minor head protein [Rhizobium sp. CFBP 8762]MBD8556305.1 minor capsid protein [Rhizobium sp. CFBP 8762]